MMREVRLFLCEVLLRGIVHLVPKGTLEADQFLQFACTYFLEQHRQQWLRAGAEVWHTQEDQPSVVQDFPVVMSPEYQEAFGQWWSARQEGKTARAQVEMTDAQWRAARNNFAWACMTPELKEDARMGMPTITGKRPEDIGDTASVTRYT